MKNALFITQRELVSFFATPVAYVFIFIFLVLSGVFTFLVGNLFERNQADLIPFFSYQPWLFLFLVPAMGMRTWSEERKSGTIELLMTLPISVCAAVLGKFLAAWLIIGLSLCLTFPLWLTVDFLGKPDQGTIVAGYLGSWLMSAAFLSISMCMSAITKNQIVAFILAIVMCFIFVVSGTGIVLDGFSGWVNTLVLDTIASFSFLFRFEAIARGVISLGDVLYFLVFSGVWLTMSFVIIEYNKADE